MANDVSILENEDFRRSFMQAVRQSVLSDKILTAKFKEGIFKVNLARPEDAKVVRDKLHVLFILNAQDFNPSHAYRYEEFNADVSFNKKTLSMFHIERPDKYKPIIDKENYFVYAVMPKDQKIFDAFKELCVECPFASQSEELMVLSIPQWKIREDPKWLDKMPQDLKVYESVRELLFDRALSKEQCEGLSAKLYERDFGVKQDQQRNFGARR